MGGDDGKRSGELLGWIAAAGAILFIVDVGLIVMLQTVLPAFDIKVGAPSDASIGSMLAFALVALGLLPAAAWFSRKDK